jgi:hypothetical protein
VAVHAAQVGLDHPLREYPGVRFGYALDGDGGFGEFRQSLDGKSNVFHNSSWPGIFPAEKEK